MDVKALPLDDYLYLSGRPSIRDFVSFARRHKINGVRPDKEPLIREWRTANELIRQLERTEKGIADGLEALPLPEDMLPIADAELETPAVQSMWAGFAYRWRLIELDRISSNRQDVAQVLLLGHTNTFLRFGYQVGTPEDVRSNAIVGESRAVTQRLFTAYRRWEAPLETARFRAPAGRSADPTTRCWCRRWST